MNDLLHLRPDETLTIFPMQAVGGLIARARREACGQRFYAEHCVLELEMRRAAIGPARVLHDALQLALQRLRRYSDAIIQPRTPYFQEQLHDHPSDNH